MNHSTLQILIYIETYISFHSNFLLCNHQYAYNTIRIILQVQHAMYVYTQHEEANSKSHFSATPNILLCSTWVGSRSLLFYDLIVLVAAADGSFRYSVISDNGRYSIL